MKSFLKYAVTAAVVAGMLGGIVSIAGAEDMGEQGNRGDHQDKVMTAATVNVACIQKAVGMRDDAVIAAFDAYHTAIHNALVARRDALKAAWALTDRSARRTALANAWQNYRDARRNATKTMRETRLAAWSQFYTDRKACGANGEPGGGQGNDANL